MTETKRIKTKKPTKAGDAPWWVFVLINFGDVKTPEGDSISAEVVRDHFHGFGQFSHPKRPI
jgi:hypothetical protein